MAGSLTDVHRILSLLLTAERLSVGKTQIMKCMAVLVTVTPYSKLGPDLLEKTLSPVWNYTTCKGT